MGEKEDIISSLMDGSGTQRLRVDPTTLPPFPKDYPLPGDYISIPLPPREENKDSRLFSRKAAHAVDDSPRDTSHPRKLRPPRRPRSKTKPFPEFREQQRRKEFAQSLLSAFVLNCVIVVLLFFTIVRERIPPPIILFEVSTQNDPAKNSSKSSGEAPPKPGFNDEAAIGAAAASTSLITATAIQEFSVTPKFHTEFTPSLSTHDVLTPAMGASIQSSDFAAVKNQRKEAIRKFIESNNASGSSGDGTLPIGEEKLKSIFSAEDFGDGSGMMLLTDISGSMREIGETVDSYVQRTFPKSTSSKVVGCSFKHLIDPAVEEILRSARRGNFTDYVFVCDLQDGEGAVAIGRIRKALINDKRKIHLHVISFDQSPGPHLNRLIMDSGGAFTRVRRVMVPVSEEKPAQNE